MKPKLNNILSVKNFGHDNRYHCYIRDWQGNIHNDRDYYPYGLPTSVSSIPESDSYGFSGKELERFRGLNIYDFEARTYVPDEARFWQPDPMADNYPGISPYAYCAGDPINFIDPTGEKVYYVDMTGRLVTPSEALKDFNQAEYEKGLEGLDRVVVIGENGQIIGESQTYPEGTINPHDNSKSDLKGVDVTLFEVKEDEASTDVFETLSKAITTKTGIEFAHITRGTLKKKGKADNIVFTGHAVAKVEYFMDVMKHIYQDKLRLRDVVHSHRLNYMASKSDHKIKEWINNAIKNPLHQPKHYIYAAHTRIYNEF